MAISSCKNHVCFIFVLNYVTFILCVLHPFTVKDVGNVKFSYRILH